MNEHKLLPAKQPAEERVVARLRKLLELARRGEGGEKDNAQRFLEKLLARNGMTMADLEDQDAELVELKLKYNGSKLEHDLIVAIVCNVLRARNFAARDDRAKGGKYMTLRVSKFQRLEIELRVQHLPPAFRKKLDLMFSAFIHTNELYSGVERDPDEPPAKCELSQEDLTAIAMMAMGMRKTVIPRGTLSHGSGA